MTMPVRVTLGYGGSGSIAGSQVFLTGGSFEAANAIAYLNMIQTLPSTAMAGRVQHADGTVGYSGSLNFDVYDGMMGVFSPSGGLLQRYYKFAVGLNVGGVDLQMRDCMVSSVSLQGAAGGLVSASVSFLSLTGTVTGATPDAFLRDTEPMGYWHSGSAVGDNLRDWNLAMTQEASLAYTNEDTVEPNYIKVGPVSYVLTVNAYQALTTPATILIGTTGFSLTGNSVARGFAFTGITDIGTYSYTFETSSDTGHSDALVIS